jgi:hypothetical protein
VGNAMLIMMMMNVYASVLVLSWGWLRFGSLSLFVFFFSVLRI